MRMGTACHVHVWSEETINPTTILMQQRSPVREAKSSGLPFGKPKTFRCTLAALLKLNTLTRQEA